MERELTNILKKHNNGTTIESIRVCKELLEVKEKLAISGPYNIYCLHVDLASDKDLSAVKLIRQKDPFGKIVLFVENVECLNVLFEVGVSVLDYREINSSIDSQIELIRETYLHLLLQKENMSI